MNSRNNLDEYQTIVRGLSDRIVEAQTPIRVLDAIKEEGTQQSQVEQMLTRARLYELVDYEGYNAFDTGIFNFDVPTLDIGANHADL